MMLNNKEKVEVQNLLKVIRRASFKEMEGLEALALARAYHWLESLLVEPKIIPQVVQSLPQVIAPIEEKNSIVEAPVEESKPIKRQKKSK